MCLAVPAKIIELKDASATVEMDGLRKEISIELLEEIKVGDYVIVHVGYALSKLEQKEAEAMLEMIRELPE
jgi:hydrogenase expression/formation protein HypC